MDKSSSGSRMDYPGGDLARKSAQMSQMPTGNDAYELSAVGLQEPLPSQQTVDEL
jgi:hypothetical protein